ncbi:MAG: IcmT/TraK family protein [Alphaproteobacteria bacterium]|nr:IcmT/TraK family protein [Alphaproteobacteria bacterium]
MDSHWRNTQKPARFFFFDARSASAVFLFLLHARLWTFCVVVVVMLAFWIIERRGYSFAAALRAIRSWIVGRRRPSVLDKFRRRWIDFLGR